MGPMDLNGTAGLQVSKVGQVVGKEAAFHAVDAKVEAVAVGRRCDGVGTGLLLAVGVSGDGGDELAGCERETLDAFDDELEVVALGNLGDADFLFKTCGQKLAGQGVSHSLKR